MVADGLQFTEMDSLYPSTLSFQEPSSCFFGNSFGLILALKLLSLNHVAIFN